MEKNISHLQWEKLYQPEKRDLRVVANVVDALTIFQIVKKLALLKISTKLEIKIFKMLTCLDLLIPKKYKGGDQGYQVTVNSEKQATHIM